MPMRICAAACIRINTCARVQSQLRSYAHAHMHFLLIKYTDSSTRSVSFRILLIKRALGLMYLHAFLILKHTVDLLTILGEGTNSKHQFDIVICERYKLFPYV